MKQQISQMWLVLLCFVQFRVVVMEDVRGIVLREAFAELVYLHRLHVTSLEDGRWSEASKLSCVVVV